MKRLLLGVAAAAMTFSGVAAQAQTWRGHDDHRGGYDQHRGYDRGHDQSRGWTGNRYDNRRFDTGSRWRQGQVYPDYARRDRMISDWRRYNLPAPRAGYGYYRDDNGDVVMAALASGLIGLVVGNAISDHNDYGYQPYGYQPYGYGY